MKTKFILSLFMVSLFGCCHLSAQQQSLFYYYKGNPISLNVNTQHFLVYADTNKISRELFEKEYRVTEWIEDGSNGILEAQINIPNGNYDGVLKNLKEKEYVIDIEPVIGDSILTNTSRLFYVRLHDTLGYSLLSSTAQSIGAEIRGKVDFCDNWYELRVNKNSDGNSIEVANLFWETGYFANIDPGFILHFEPASVTTCVSDPRFDEQWGMQAIKACSAWKITKGDTNVRIAVIDMGIDESHREFDSTYVVFSYDMDTDTSPARCSCKEPPRDHIQPGSDPICFFHGLHVGGIIFANHNRDSVAGICPNAGLINLSHSFKLYEDTCIRKLAEAIQLSVLHGAKVINNSWECSKTQNNQLSTSLLEEAIDTALAHDCVIVFAAGNHASGDHVDSSVSYPANYKPELLVVGAICPDFTKLQCSSYGPNLDIVAPGLDILSTHKQISTHNVLYDYIESFGTSMAAPHVSSVAGLMFSINPELTGKDVRDIIEQTVRKDFNENFTYDSLNENGSWNMEVGYGLLDAHRAVLKAAYYKVYGDTALTFCDTSRHPYTVRAPHNANIDSVSFFWTCSDNLQIVAGQNTDSVWVKFTNSGIGQLQCHIIHDGDTVTSTLDISNMSGRTMYDNLTLNSSLSYPDTFVLSREVVVDSLSMLTWQDKTVLCTPDCRLIVRPRGLLTLNHTTLTSACPNELWQGIEVVGDRTKRQMSQYQGKVELTNGATIKNALCGIRTGLREDTLVFATTGGIVTADSAFFTNNRRAVEINSYAYTNPSGDIADYAASFSRCSFTVDNSNLFAANNTAFSEHARLWDVRGVTFYGCVFGNLTVGISDKGRGIYADDAGVCIENHCSRLLLDGECECPQDLSTHNSFSGFATAIEVNTTGNPYTVRVNRADFENNTTGILVHCNNFVTVTRCGFNLQRAPSSSTNTGLVLDNCSSYKVEGNRFHKTGVSTKLTSFGVRVINSGSAANSIYKNIFDTLDYGIQVSQDNSGLQLGCDTFSFGDYDIYILSNGSLASNQGTPRQGADNKFVSTQTSSLYNAAPKKLNYYHSQSICHTPFLPHNATIYGNADTCDCVPTLCNGGVPDPGPVTSFASQVSAYTSALAGTDDDGLVGANDYSPLQALQQSLSETYYNAVRTLMSDTVLDLAALELWHTAAQPIGDPYSLTETRFMEGYAEMFAENAEDAEMANYAEFHALKLALRDQNDNADNQDSSNSLNSLNSPFINWYALTPAQIAQLQTIAERNTGRASVMAKGVLCFFYGICYEDEWDDTDTFDASLQGDDTTGTRSKRTAMDNANDAALSVYPNPTDDILFIELSGGAGIANVALYDLQGRIMNSPNSSNSPFNSQTLDVKSVPAGTYILRVTDTDGKENHRKIVRK